MACARMSGTFMRSAKSRCPGTRMFSSQPSAGSPSACPSSRWSSVCPNLAGGLANPLNAFTGGWCVRLPIRDAVLRAISSKSSIPNLNPFHVPGAKISMPIRFCITLQTQKAGPLVPERYPAFVKLDGSDLVGLSKLKLIEVFALLTFDLDLAFQFLDGRQFHVAALTPQIVLHV